MCDIILCKSALNSKEADGNPLLIGRMGVERKGTKHNTDHLYIQQIFHFEHFKLVESTNYCFGAIGVEIQFSYNQHGWVGHHMKDLDQIIYVFEGFFISNILRWANLRINVLGLLG